MLPNGSHSAIARRTLPLLSLLGRPGLSRAVRQSLPLLFPFVKTFSLKSTFESSVINYLAAFLKRCVIRVAGVYSFCRKVSRGFFAEKIEFKAAATFFYFFS